MATLRETHIGENAPEVEPIEEREEHEEREDVWLLEVAAMLRQLVAARVDVRQFVADLHGLRLDTRAVIQDALAEYLQPPQPLHRT